MNIDPGPDYQKLLADALRQIRSLKAANAAARAVPPVAVIGLGCRFPGGAEGPDAYWRMLLDGVDGIVELPAGRWDQATFFRSLGVPDAEQRRVYGGFLAQVDGFDPEFFGISPREAADIDPQQRLLLEVVHEALEHAGIPPSTLSGSDTGVYVGVHSQSSDYFFLQAADPAGVTPHSATGTAHNVAAGRIAYLWDLRGPAMAVDTACSSGLVAVHLACQALRTGEVSLALAGGVNLRLLPLFPTATARMGDWPGDYRCKSFDARADGVISGEGGGMVVLKRLEDALRDGDPVRAVILGSATNQDGASLGLTAPNAQAQKAVIARALSMAGRSGTDVTYVETHGTGTRLGDPIEVEALAEILGGSAPPCLLGAVKSNFGHLEGAAGIAGLAKAVLAMERGMVPPNLHFQAPNPEIPFAATRFQVPVAPTPWTGERRLAGVSSFGWSGTNAHVVLAPAPEAAPATMADGPVLLPLSARGPAALRDLSARMRDWLNDADPPAGDMAYTAARRRDHHRCRLAVVGADAAGLAAALADATVGEPATGPLVFVFSGQGNLRQGAAAGLGMRESAFRAALDQADAAIVAAGGPGVAGLLLDRPDGVDVPVTDVMAAACGLFVLQVALLALYRHWGVEPETVIGHSLGEVAAAHAAGCITLEAAARITVARTRLSRQAAGATAALALEETAARAAIDRLGLDLAVAAINGPDSVAVSGDGDAIDRLVADLTSRGIQATRLSVPIAFHGPRMAGPAAALAGELTGLTAVTPRLTMISTVTAAPLIRAPDAAYWARNLRERVDFRGALEQLLSAGATPVFLEIGAHPALCPAIARTAVVGGVAAMVVPGLRRGTDDHVGVLSALGRLYGAGIDTIRWDRLYPAGRVLDLPTYPWQRRRFWHEGSGNAPLSFTMAAQPVPLYAPGWVPDQGTAVGAGPLRALALGPGAGVLADTLAVPGAPAGADLVLVADGAGDAAAMVAEAAVALTGSAGRVHLLVTEPTPVAGALWGLHRGFALEHPERAGHRLLAGEGADAAAIASLLARPGMDEFRLDDGIVQRQRLLPVQGPDTVPRLRGDGTYLVTGGTGGLGRTLCRWLLARGAGDVVLLSRRPDPAGDGADPRVIWRAADCADTGAMAALLDDMRRTLPPLRGVVHAAGMLDDGILAAQNPDRIRAVLAAKLDGALLLDRLTRDDPLDLFLLCSSLAGLLGAPGQAVYAAANAGLDALADARRAQGRPALSVAWPVLAGPGLAAGGGAMDIGLDLLGPEQVMAVLDRVLGLDAPVLAPLPVDWGRFRGLRAGSAPAPLIADLVRGEGPAVVPAARDLRAEVLALPVPARLPAIEAAMAVLSAQVLSIAPTLLDPDLSLLRQGLDSFTAIELHRHVEKGFGVSLPLAASLAGGSVVTLAVEVEKLLSAAPAAEPAVPDGDLARLMADIDTLSEEEVEALLAAEAAGSAA
ncbi:type I polyketide synthase [Niveispirillum sp. KHB5.9]|uniref:type I polyketide synthase n=1 Tax=Niveispirillum sp. KHB5.9 TaxID=3400269 RepID=UPI003A853E21